LRRSIHSKRGRRVLNGGAVYAGLPRLGNMSAGSGAASTLSDRSRQPVICPVAWCPFRRQGHRGGQRLHPRGICRPLNARFATKSARAQSAFAPVAEAQWRDILLHPRGARRRHNKSPGTAGASQIPLHPARGGALRARQGPGSITTRTANWLSSTDHDDWSEGSPVRRTTPFPYRGGVSPLWRSAKAEGGTDKADASPTPPTAQQTLKSGT
jgi:hypothetical protein